MAAVSAQLLMDVVRTTGQVPARYVRPVHDRPNLAQVLRPSKASIPVVDLQQMDGPRHLVVIKEIERACSTAGFFQVKNHGIPKDLVEETLRISREFFSLPEPERLEMYSDDPTKTARLSTSFNVKTEEVGSWRDFLRLHCHPLEDFVHEWPSNPSSFRRVVGEYSMQARKLSLKLLRAISESLGLEKDCVEKALGKQAQHMAINYYPPCPNPELTYGLPGHKDPNAITVLLQDDVPGLQVLRNGKWVEINPVPDALIVNIGDQLQVLSNGRYKSVLHRVVVNSEKERMSIATFYCPSMDAVIEPPAALVDKNNPPAYRTFTYGEYFGKFWNRGLKTGSCLDLFQDL